MLASCGDEQRRMPLSGLVAEAGRRLRSKLVRHQAYDHVRSGPGVTGITAPIRPLRGCGEQLVFTVQDEVEVRVGFDRLAEGVAGP